MITNQNNDQEKNNKYNIPKEAMAILNPLTKDPAVLKMHSFIQHGRVTTYDHCLQVAGLSYRINCFLRAGCDEQSLVRGAMLHDFYLYDWHKKDNGTHDWHGFIHAKRALDNAEKHFTLTEKEKQIIYCHMWPLNLTRIPPCKEAWIVCFADKLVSIKETMFNR